MLPLLALPDGRSVYLDGTVVTQDDAIAIARRLCSTWGRLHEKAEAKVLIVVEPRRYGDGTRRYGDGKGTDSVSFSECPHYNTLEEGLEGEGWKKFGLKGKE